MSTSKVVFDKGVLTTTRSVVWRHFQLLSQSECILVVLEIYGYIICGTFKICGSLASHEIFHNMNE